MAGQIICTRLISKFPENSGQTKENSDRTGNLAGTEAPSTNVDMARSTIDYGLDTADVCLPCPVGTTMGVGDLNPEADTLAANIALCHFPAPPYSNVTDTILPYFYEKIKHNLLKKMTGYILVKM